MGHKGNTASLTVVLVWLALTLRHLSLTFLPPKQNFIWNFLCQGQISALYSRYNSDNKQTIFSNYKTTENMFK